MFARLILLYLFDRVVLWGEWSSISRVSMTITNYIVIKSFWHVKFYCLYSKQILVMLILLNNFDRLQLNIIFCELFSLSLSLIIPSILIHANREWRIGDMKL